MSDMAEVAPGLFVGGWSAARDCYRTFDTIVNVAVDAPHFGGYHFPLIDGPGSAFGDMWSAIDCVAGALMANKRILVHCVGGRSRSVVVAAAAWARYSGARFEDSLLEFANVRGSVTPKPEAYLIEQAREVLQILADNK